MYALILAAGRGERMRPLTDKTPKPLLYAGKRRLIEHRIDALVAARITRIVINHAHLGEQIVHTLGDGGEYGAEIIYSPEPEGALETGGGIFNALPLLQSDPFLVVNSDIWTNYDFKRVPRRITAAAHLVLVDNPVHHPQGDFRLDGQWVRPVAESPRGGPLTFSGIGVYRQGFFNGCAAGKFPLAPVLHAASTNQEVTGEYHPGEWTDIGTPQRLHALDKKLRHADRVLSRRRRS